MADKLTFFTNPQSRGRIARWMLEECGADYETRVIQYGDEMKGAGYLAVNPMGKVPALQHGDVIVTECAAICAYLADAFPDAGLAPPPAERGAYYRWLFFAAGPLEAAITDKAMGLEPAGEQQRMAGYGSFAVTMDVLEQAVSNTEYLGGPSFSAADVYVGCQVGWGLQFGTIDKRQAFADYWARVSNRDACARANELDDALAA